MKNSIAEVRAVQEAAEVAFRGASLVTTKIDGVPYVAMRPIVEAIGIDWKNQLVKLRDNAEKFNCGDITMVAADGKKREMLCIPLRKLNGWLFSINPAKVREDLREKVIAYQEECFEVLYKYWNEGIAINQRFLTPEQQRLVQQAIGTKVHKRPKSEHKLAFMQEYRQIKDHFHVASYSQVPMDRFSELMQFIDAEFVAPQPPAKPVKYHFPRETAKTPEMFSGIQQWMTYKAIMDERFQNPIYLLLKQHHANGDDIEGCWLVYQAMMHIMSEYRNTIATVEAMARSTQQRGLNVLFR